MFWISAPPSPESGDGEQCGLSERRDRSVFQWHAMRRAASSGPGFPDASRQSSEVSPSTNFRRTPWYTGLLHLCQHITLAEGGGCGGDILKIECNNTHKFKMRVLITKITFRRDSGEMLRTCSKFSWNMILGASLESFHASATRFGQRWVDVTQSGPKLIKLGPMLTKLGRPWSKSRQ